MKELEECGLIEKKRQGLNRPNLIYVKNFVTGPEGQPRSCQKDNSGVVQREIQELSKVQTNNTESNNTDLSDTDPVQSYSKQLRIYSGSRTDTEQNSGEKIDDTEVFRSIIEENISLDILKERYPRDADLLDEMVSIILDVVCSDREKILVGREKRDKEQVKKKLLKLNSMHMEYVLEMLSRNTTEITNMRQYLIAVLYNASQTMEAYYRARVNHDMAQGLLVSGFCKSAYENGGDDE